MSRSPQQLKHQQGSLVDFFEFEAEETGADTAPAAGFVDYVEDEGADIEKAPPSEEVQRMPEHYYHEVESFLSRPTPQFGEGPLRHLKVSNNAKFTTVNNLLASTMSKRKVSTDSSAAVVTNSKAKVNFENLDADYLPENSRIDYKAGDVSDSMARYLAKVVKDAFYGEIQEERPSERMS